MDYEWETTSLSSSCIFLSRTHPVVGIIRNGVYWGVYNMVERPDNDFAASYFGGEKDNWFFTNHGGSGTVDRSRWDYLIGPLSSKPMSDALNYQEMQQYLNVTSYADYILAGFYVGLSDWPSNNCTWRHDTNVLHASKTYLTSMGRSILFLFRVCRATKCQ
jgi:hypothetical protein